MNDSSYEFVPGEPGPVDAEPGAHFTDSEIEELRKVASSNSSMRASESPIAVDSSAPRTFGGDGDDWYRERTPVDIRRTTREEFAALVAGVEDEGVGPYTDE